MPKLREKYVVNGVDVYDVRNRNEMRVVKALQALLKNSGAEVSAQSVKDAYAFALNRLPSRYTQQGTIVLRDPVRQEDVDEIVASAYDHVIQNPK